MPVDFLSGKCVYNNSFCILHCSLLSWDAMKSCMWLLTFQQMWLKVKVRLLWLRSKREERKILKVLLRALNALQKALSWPLGWPLLATVIRSCRKWDVKIWVSSGSKQRIMRCYLRETADWELGVLCPTAHNQRALAYLWTECWGKQEGRLR
jgi:hypothetical protein